jgi:hypothetical protein
MAHRPYPNRDRSLRQVERVRAAQAPQASPDDIFAYFESDECRQKMRELGTRLNDLFMSVTAGRAQDGSRERA